MGLIGYKANKTTYCRCGKPMISYSENDLQMIGFPHLPLGLEEGRSMQNPGCFVPGDSCPNKWLNAPCSGVKSHPERWKEEEKG